VSLLERGLGHLKLDHYENLWDPTLHLRDILFAISRAKDELVGPESYLELADKMRASATDEASVVAAEKAIEVARVYAFYQAELDRLHLLDFGDLIFKAVRLLQTNPDIRDTIRATYPQVLVDEYQDVNRASGVFLQAIAGAGGGLWVVGDERQAIYRFRGASPANMRLFASDFPGAVVRTLGRNYRSQPAIVDAFSALAPRMRATAGQTFDGWQPERPAAGGQVVFEIAQDQDAEGDGIAREVRRQETAGIALRDQAVLCRSHTALARIATALERAGVPVLYLGDVFERPEVRDLLSLLQLACEPDGRGLVRVAEFPEYGIPFDDVQTLLRTARQQSVPFPRALGLSVDGVSEAGRRGLDLLRRHLDGLCYGTQPWWLLTEYLFVRSAYVRHLLCDAPESVAGRQRRLALYQFLQFVHDEWQPQTAEQEVDPKRRLLRYVRQLEQYGEEKQLRQVPAWAESIDAVRLMTVHASKGLEFRAVYLPVLGSGYFPARKQPRPCPPPSGMLPAACEEHEEEEECLFFVALSRARDVLVLSRAQRYGKQNSKPSCLLESIEDVLPRSPGDPPTWTACEPAQERLAETPRAALPFDVRQLEVYMRCP
ncbi:MAG TPA: ATP-dependent helicase, partial [Chloroflexota bacterium]|nr:ATP-dependent helicase [Chloroflexota bacterium]